VTAKEDIGMKVAKKEVGKGLTSVALNLTPQMKLLVWFAINFNKDMTICGGDETPMTGPDSNN